MTSEVFYRKWRPQILAEVVGQEHVTKTLFNALTTSRVSHAYLFCGPRGTGKTSSGRILAKAVNCITNEGKGEPCNTCTICQDITAGRALDVIEVDAASNRGIDEIRDLREKVNYTPNQARYKVYIIDEVHMLTKEASNALLKTLEEPPPHIIFILATTEAHKVLPTILSRCQRFDFRRISQSDVVSKLTHICEKEGIQIEPEALRLIAKATTGSLRDAENLLQQLATFYGSEIELKQAQSILGITGDLRAKELISHIINSDIPAGVNTINSVNNDGIALRQFNRELVEYLRALLLIKTGSGDNIDLTSEDKSELKGLADKASLPQILKAIKLFSQLDIGFDNYSTLPLELALVDSTLTQAEKVEEKKEPARQVKAEQPVSTTKPPVNPPPAEQAVISQPTTAPIDEPPPVSQPTAAPIDEPPPVSQPTAAPIDEPPPVSQPTAAPPDEKPAVKPKPASTPIQTLKIDEETPAKIPEPDSEIGQMKLNWKQLINEAPDGSGRTPAAALLRTAIPKTIENNTVILSFKYPFHKDNMEKIENLKTAKIIIGNFLRRDCNIRCVYEPEDNHMVEAAQKIGARIIDTEEK